MKLTKYEHSCFTLEKDGAVLVVDPGAWVTDYAPTENIIAIVVTHEHADHFDQEKLQLILQKNPDAIIYGPASVVSQIPDMPSQVVEPAQIVEVGVFKLEFVGGVHSTIHKDFHPEFQNVGVIVNDILYHPGDSLALPGRPIEVLSVPIIAPWEKASDSMDFMMTTKPLIAFPSHDSILSETGITLYDRWHAAAAEKHGINYQRLTEPMEING